MELAPEGVARLIEELTATLDFDAAAARVVEATLSLSREALLVHLDHAGVIPEEFDHDSSEEKLFAKLQDALLARAWRELGLDARVLEARGDAADVLGEGDGWSVVGDAKAFRLSRTAKNQKDSKVGALEQWRRNEGADYACLVCPRYQLPSRASQVYAQAATFGVLLLSYTHLRLLVKKGLRGPLRALFEAPRRLPAGQSAAAHWAVIDQAVLELAGATEAEWRAEVEALSARIASQATRDLAHLEAERRRIESLGRDEAIRELLEARGIDRKIATIEKTTGARAATPAGLLFPL